MDDRGGRGRQAPRTSWTQRATGRIAAPITTPREARPRRRCMNAFAVALAAMPALAIGTAKADRSILSHAFNPGSLGVAVAALAGVALITREGRPSGRRPLRQAPDHPPAVEEPP